MLHIECKPDETLATFLGKTRKQIRHHNDKGRVCKFLRENQSCLAMIDEDPGSAQPPYLNTLTIIKPRHFQLTKLEDANRNNKVIIVGPRLEDWLIYTCHEAGVDIRNFGFSNRASHLHREINSRLNRLRDLLHHLHDRDAQPLAYLRSLLN